MSDAWNWGINQGNAIQQGRLATENARIRAEKQDADKIGLELVGMLGEAQQAQTDFATWKASKKAYPLHSNSIDIECAVSPQLYADAPLNEKRLINLKLCAWAEFWSCYTRGGDFLQNDDATKLKSLSESMMHMETMSAVRNAAKALEDVANRLELIGDPLFEDPHAWVAARVADMQTTVKWKASDPTIPEADSLQGRQGKPIIIQDIEQKKRETIPDYIFDTIGRNIQGVGELALR